MDSGLFTSTTYGTVVKTPGKFGFYTYLTARLSRVSGRSNRWIARDLHDALVGPLDTRPMTG